MRAGRPRYANEAPTAPAGPALHQPAATPSDAGRNSIGAKTDKFRRQTIQVCMPGVSTSVW